MRRTGIGLIWVAGVILAAAENEPGTVVLDNGTMRMVINLHGGAVSSCTLAGSELNPFSWKAKRWPGDPSVKEGLFICFDRLGKSSAADLERGIPFHGEATGVRWEVLEKNIAASGGHVLRLRCRLPIAAMTLNREYHLFKDSSVCRITDRIRNENSFRKRYNVLHHPSLAPPFLDRSVLVDCNASAGFVNTRLAGEIPGPVISWPEVEYRSRRINLHHMTDGEDLVVNYVCADEARLGWGGVANPQKRLLIGCLWPVADYPWTRIWREWDGEEPRALGIEFGTTPLGIPLEEIEQVGDLFGRPTMERLDPGTETEKLFYLFLSEIPADYSGTGNILLEEDAVTIQESGIETPRRWKLPCSRIDSTER